MTEVKAIGDEHLDDSLRLATIWSQAPSLRLTTLAHASRVNAKAMSTLQGGQTHYLS